MTAATKALGGLSLALGASALHAAHWRRRARAASPVEIEQATNSQLAELSTADIADGCGLAAYYLVEAETPPVGDRRWFWWVASTCGACDVIHDPLTGYAESKRAGRDSLAAATDYLTDPDSCPNPDDGVSA